LSSLLKKNETKELQEGLFSSFYVTNLIVSLSHWNLDHLKYIFNQKQDSNEFVLFMIHQGVKNQKFTLEMMKFFVESLKDTKTMNSIHWKILSEIIQHSKMTDSWDLKIETLFKESKKKLIVEKLIFDVCIAYGSIYFVKNGEDNKFLQFLSNVLFDDEIEEDKFVLKDLFEMVQLKSSKRPVFLPKPIIDKVDFNSTFSKLQ
jgi:hypothetical protein